MLKVPNLNSNNTETIFGKQVQPQTLILERELFVLLQKFENEVAKNLPSLCIRHFSTLKF